jgi:serine/threonine-protein kinase HipA
MLNAPVLAVDPHPPFLQLLRQRAKQAGMEERIRVREAPLHAPPAAPGSIDLLWSEGRLTMGLPTALKRWRPFLRPRGLLVVTAPTWLTDQRPEEAVQFWRACAPEMADAGGTRKLAVAAGFEVLDHLMLPRHGWLEDFYDPLKTILEESRRKAAAQSALTAMLDEAQAEIDLCQRAGHSYSSAHYLLRRTD